MSNEDRRKQILSLISDEGYVSVTDLARSLFISEPTVRRDLAALEKEGSIRRTHGGASFIENGPNFWPLNMRNKVNLREKEYVGRLAAGLIKENDHIFIDTGSTDFCLAKALEPSMQLTVATNGLPIAMLLASQPTKTVECCGGFYDARDSAFYGEDTLEFIRKRRARYFFVSTGSMDAQYGASGFDSKGIASKHAFSENAETTVLLMDHTKEDKVSYYQVFTWDQIDILITDRRPGDELMEACRQHRVQVLYGPGE
ncbi:MAG: DeoR/GlpR transcriptional regulator [Clostridia bacterium]|nr:DeoR/GlpR transcriptional regulator [Clostridia bacterium]